jgi:ATP-dependent RNA helicase RhlE
LKHFSDLELCNPVLEAVADEGYDTPTPIQAKAIPPILDGRDVLGCAQTGTGKTAAFALPILHRLHQAPVDKSRRGPRLPRVLVLSPTRELATQIEESFHTYGRHTGLRQTVVYGGVSQYHQVKALRAGVDVLIATPGRLMDLMEQGHVNLREVQVFVLDEADRMLDMGFIQPIRKIASNVPPKRQTLLFSATMPKDIMHLADSLLCDPVKVAVTPVASATPLVEQAVYMVPKESKLALMQHLLDQRGVDRALVFTRTKHGAEKLARKLNRESPIATAIHGNKSQNQRQRALEAFRSGRSRVLVATDVAARGLDVDGITHVFNFELPNEPETYRPRRRHRHRHLILRPQRAWLPPRHPASHRQEARRAGRPE